MDYNNNYSTLPIQLLKSSEKTPDWIKSCADSLENIGRTQLHNNLGLLENYQILKGEFIFSHYFDRKDYADMLSILSKEIEIPFYLKHYDITAKAVNLLSGEYQKRPDIFRVKAFDEQSSNDFLRAKTGMLLEYITQQINEEVNLNLQKEGIDINKSDFKSEEEQQQFQQQVQQRTKVLTPKEIENYMQQHWMSAGELWGEHQIELDKEQFRFDEKDKIEFEDMLTSARCFRHFYLNSDYYEQETWNPVNTFYHKSPDVTYIEDGDYVGRIFYLTPSAVISRYGWRMKKSEIEAVEQQSKTYGKNKNYSERGLVSGSHVPYEGYGNVQMIKEGLGVNLENNGKLMPMDEAIFSNWNNNSLDTSGYIQVIEGYWRGKQKINKITFIDPDTGILRSEFADDTLIIPKGFKVLDISLDNVSEVNTVVSTWVDSVYEVTKIKIGADKDDAIYLGGQPCKFQFKGDNNIYGAKLPVCGLVFNGRNGRPHSLIDLMKPDQIGHNIAMNQLYQIMQKEIGKFIVMDVNMLPHDKDWGGEKGWEKFMLVAKSLGLAPTDTSPGNMAGANLGGQLPKVVDMELSASMQSRIMIAQFFEDRALKQIGLSQQRLGNIASSESATGVNQAVGQSFASTESYFTEFSNYKRRYLSMNLDIAQYVQSKKETVTVSYTKSDLSRAFIQIAGTSLLGRQMGIYVVKSQELIRQLETLKQFVLSNNTTGASTTDIATILTSYSIKEILAKLKETEAKNRQLEEQKQSQQQQQFEQSQQMTEQIQNDLKEKEQLDRESREKIAYIQTFGRQEDNLKDTDVNDSPDILEYEKLANLKSATQATVDYNKNKLDNDQQKNQQTNLLKQKELAQKDRELKVKQEIANKQLSIAKINKN